MILLGLLLAGDSLLHQVVPNPTGRNAYEDYLQAGDSLGDIGLVQIYATWSPEQYAAIIRPRTSRDDAPPPTAAQIALAQHLHDMNLLDIRREMAARYAKAVDYLRIAADKKCWQPREKFEFATKTPEYNYFDKVGKVAVAAAYANFADGRGRQGTQILLDTIGMAENMEGGPTIASLYKIVMEDNALRAMHQHFPAMGSAEAVLVEKAVAKLLAEPTKFLQLVRDEMAMRLSTFSGWLEDPSKLTEGTSQPAPDLVEWVKNIKSLTPDQRRSLVGTAQNVINASFEPILATFKRPESEWNTVETNAMDDQALSDDIKGIVRYWRDMTATSRSNMPLYQAEARTRLRLAGLYASVVRYKWDHGKLPGTLEEAVGSERVKDPLSGEKFSYELVGAWDFRVYSRGSKATGEVGLDSVTAPGAIAKPTPP